MKNLKIKKALKTMILLGSSLVLIPNIGCSEAETIEVVEVVNNTNEVNETPMITVEPTIKPTETPEPTATPAPTMIPEPSEEDKKYYSELTDEELMELEKQASDFYDEMAKDRLMKDDFKTNGFTKEDFINYLYLIYGVSPKYENSDIQHISDASNEMDFILFYFNVSGISIYSKRDDCYEKYEFLSKTLLECSEEYRIVKNLELEFRNVSITQDAEKMAEYFLKYVELFEQAKKDKTNIFNLSNIGSYSVALLLGSQASACSGEMNELNINMSDFVSDDSYLDVEIIGELTEEQKDAMERFPFKLGMYFAKQLNNSTNDIIDEQYQRYVKSLE